MYPVKTSVGDTDSPLPSEKIGERERGERVSLPDFLREGASVNAFFQKRSSQSADIFVNAGLSFSCSCGQTKMNVFEWVDHSDILSGGHNPDIIKCMPYKACNRIYI